MVANEIMSDVLDSSFLHDLLSDAHCAEVLAKSPVVAGKRGGLAKSKRPADESVNRPDERKLLVAEILKKTSDQEQLREFLCQTGENFASIREILQKMAGSKSKTALFDQCHFYLTDLKAVADTAGYERLGRFYDHWLSKVVARQREAAAGKKVSFDFMVDYVKQVAALVMELHERQNSLAEAGGEVDRERESGTRATPDSAAVESTSETQPVSPELTEKIQREIFQGDADELRNIFCRQARTSINAILNQIDEFATSNIQCEILNRCARNIAYLRTTAQKRGYRRLVRFCETWLRDIERAQGQVNGGGQPDVRFMHTYLDMLTDVLAFDAGQAAPPDKNRVNQEAETVSAASPAAPVLSTTPPEAPAEVAAEDSELFAALSKSLDAAFVSASDSELSSLHNILDEMLNGSGEEDAADRLETVLPPSGYEEYPDDTLESGNDADGFFKQPERDSLVDTQSVYADFERLLNDVTQPAQELEGERENLSTSRDIKVDVGMIDALMNQVGDLVVSKSYFSGILKELEKLRRDVAAGTAGAGSEKRIQALSAKLAEVNFSLSRVADEIQGGVMRVRMQPISQLFAVCPGLLRDLTGGTDKRVKLVVRGEDARLDKMVIKELAEPLAHIVRNAVEHGLESVEERKNAGKEAAGMLVLNAYEEDRHVVIEVIDDGRGLDTRRIKDKAVEQGLIDAATAANISDADAARFILLPGFSTVGEVGDAARSALGMDMVKNRIGKLNGTVEIDSQPGVRTCIRMKMPLNMAIIQALIVRVGSRLFTIPLTVVEKTLWVADEATTVVDGIEMAQLNETLIPLFNLSQLFAIKVEENERDEAFVVIVSTGSRRIGLVVDEELGRREVVIKPLVGRLGETREFCGATVIEDGRISLMLDVYELIKKVARPLEEQNPQNVSPIVGKVGTVTDSRA